MTDLAFSMHDPDPIGTALGAQPDEFYDALLWIECKTREVKDTKLPRSLLMIRLFGKLELEQDLDAALYVRAELGPFLPDAVEFSRSIGATRTADVLAKVVALFPNGMPRDVREYSDAGGFSKAVSEARANLDAELSDCFGELATALRDWLRSNRGEIQADIDRLHSAVGTGGPDDPAGAAALDEVLAATDPDPLQAGFVFLREAVDWVSAAPGRNGAAVVELPETARMIVLLNELTSAISSAGLLYLADWELGNNFTDLKKWVTTIRARRTQAYLDGFAALFPRQRVPRDRDKRSEALKAAIMRATKKGPDPLDALDDEFREDAMLEIPAQLREWVVKHREKVLAER